MTKLADPDDAPLILPPPPDTVEAFGELPKGMNEAAVAVRQLQLRQRKAAAGAQAMLGAALSTKWLPSDTGWPELDRARDLHLAALSRVADALAKLNSLKEKFASEDEARKAGYAEAARSGEDPPKFERTPQAERQQQLGDAEEALWSNVAALQEVVERARATLQAHEATWLALLGETEELDKAVREAERRLEEARRKRWQATALATWMKAEVEGGGPGGVFGPQPSPTGDEPVPGTFEAPGPGTFERRYFEEERRARVNADPVVLDDDPLGEGALDEGESTDLIEPLDEKDRYVQR